MFDKKKCATCKYSAKVNESEVCCVYILIEEHMRGCYGEGECPKYQKRTQRRKAQVSMGGFVYDD